MIAVEVCPVCDGGGIVRAHDVEAGEVQKLGRIDNCPLCLGIGVRWPVAS